MKNLLLFCVLVLFFSSCNQEKTPAPAATTSMRGNPNEKLIQDYFEHFNNHDWTKMASMYIDTAEFKDPSLGTGIVKQTREQTARKYEELNEMFADLHDKVLKVYPSGEKNIIVEFISTGTAPDNSRFELPICTIFTIEKGLITKDYTYYDNFEE